MSIHDLLPFPSDPVPSLAAAVHEAFAASNSLVHSGGKSIVVSPVGDDANAGTVAQPKKTVGAGIAAAGGGKVLLRAGVYMEGATLQITPANSGLLLTSYDC